MAEEGSSFSQIISPVSTLRVGGDRLLRRGGVFDLLVGARCATDLVPAAPAAGLVLAIAGAATMAICFIMGPEARKK